MHSEKNWLLSNWVLVAGAQGLEPRTHKCCLTRQSAYDKIKTIRNNVSVCQGG